MNRDLEHLFVLLKHLARGRSGQVRCVSFSPCGVGMHIRPQDLHCSSLRRGRRGIFFVLMSDWKKKTCLFGRQPRPPWSHRLFYSPVVGWSAGLVDEINVRFNHHSPVGMGVQQKLPFSPVQASPDWQDQGRAIKITEGSRRRGPDSRIRPSVHFVRFQNPTP